MGSGRVRLATRTRPSRRPRLVAAAAAAAFTLLHILTAVAAPALHGPAPRSAAQPATGAAGEAPEAVLTGLLALPIHQEPAHEPAAQDHAEDEAHAAEPRPWWYWPSKWINFIALAALLYWMLVVPPKAVQDIFSFPGLRVVFVERGAAILAARDLAAQQRQEASRLLRESEERLAKIEDEVAALVTAARRDADSEQARALEEGKAQAQKIHEVAQRELRHQRVAGQRQLRRFVADLAVNMAETSLAEHLTADDQDRLIREYLSRLGPSLA